MTSGKEVTVITIQTEHSSTFTQQFDRAWPMAKNNP